MSGMPLLYCVLYIKYAILITRFIDLETGTITRNIIACHMPYFELQLPKI
jgi:hypothetical protein